jgi:hypothetical protein
MIIDKPKRRAETIAGLLEVSGGDKSTVARDQRTRRALKDAGNHFGLTISIGEMTGYLHTSRNFARLTITAVIHSESLESRWARALDMIRDQYGLEIEWEREEVREKFGGCTFAQKFAQCGASETQAGAKLAAGMGPGTYSVYIGGNRIDVPVSEETTAEEIVAALNKKAGYDFAMASEEIAKSLRSDPNRTFIADTEHDPKPPRKSYAQGASTSYADTPTGTKEWDDMTGNMRRGLLENGVPLKYRFCDALHMKIVGDHSELICPVCGGSIRFFWLRHVSDFEKPARDLCGHDADFLIEMMDGFDCDSCHHHLTYDFDNETVTIRTTSSHCMERGE